SSLTTSVRKNEKSLNSEFGVPLTILGLKTAWNSPIDWLINLLTGFYRAITYSLKPKTYPQYLVLEMGADHPGDIKYNVTNFKPTIGVLTGIGTEVPVHVEFFSTIEDLVREKSELLKALPEDGIAIINRDDARAWEARDSTRAHVISYGFTGDANIKGDNLRISYADTGQPKGMNLRVDYAGKSVPVRLCGVLGKGHAYSALAAFAVGVNMGMNIINIADALGRHKFAPCRLRILEGRNGSTLIDDTYNSSPSAVKLALETLYDINLGSRIPSCRKIAVLGDMLELGEYSESEHKKVGTWIRGVIDVLVCVGERAKWIGESAISDGFPPDHVHYFPDSVSSGNFLTSDFDIRASDVILLKASQSVRLERATEALLVDPSKANELLVRQEKEWKNKK
ncbi:MAG: Mur ligase family protein, partial [Patescibacteria group bacterium]